MALGTAGAIMAGTELVKLLLQIWSNFKKTSGLTEEEAKELFDREYAVFMAASENPVDPVRE